MNAILQRSDSHSHSAHAGSSLSLDKARILVLVGPPRDLLRPELSHEREAERQGNIWSQEVCLGAHVGHYLCRQTARLASSGTVTHHGFPSLPAMVEEQQHVLFKVKPLHQQAEVTSAQRTIILSPTLAISLAHASSRMGYL